MWRLDIDVALIMVTNHSKRNTRVLKYLSLKYHYGGYNELSSILRIRDYKLFIIIHSLYSL